MTKLSASCASAMGATTSSSGSFGKTGVPSAGAYTSPLKRKSRSQSRKASEKEPSPPRYSSSASVKRSLSRYSRAAARPQVSM